MDVVKTRSVRWWRTRKKYFAIIFLIASLLALSAYRHINNKSATLNRTELLISTVQQGKFTVQVNGYGILLPNRLRALTSPSQSTVKEIVLRPGAAVSADSVIVVLENHQLQQMLQSAEQDLSQAQANLRRLRLSQQLELLQEESKLDELIGRAESARLRLAAEQDILEQGVVPRLTFLESQINANQLKSQVDMQRKRLRSLAEIHNESIAIEDDRVQQMRGALLVAQEQVNRLHVKSGLDGILQRLSVTEGQSMMPGQEIAMIGSATDMVARLQVPQNQAEFIQLGQDAVIDTRRDQIMGKVSRIDPVVENNNVHVEISLPKDLPASARPQQSISGNIVIQQLKNAMYLERPAGIRANENGFLYRFDPESGKAERIQLSFGFMNDRFIEVRTGVNVNDKVIISDLSHLTQSIASATVR